MSVNALLMEHEQHDARCPECQSGNVTSSTLCGYGSLGEEQEVTVSECRDCGASWSD